MFVCPVRKISQVIMKWRRHISVDLLYGTTATELQKSVDLLSGTTSAELRNSVDLLWSTTNAELHNSVNLLCGTKAAEPDNPVWCIQQESHTFSKNSCEPCWKMWVEGLIQSKINGKLLKDERFGRFSKQCNVYAFRRFSKLLKDERLTKTE